MSKQMKSVFDFERICKNCKHYAISCDEPGQACFHPAHGNVWADENETCDDWVTKYDYVPMYIVED